MTIDTTTLAELKEKLLAEKARLEADLARMGKSTGVEGDYATQFSTDLGDDPDENASEVEEYVDNIGVEDNLEGQLKDVRDALVKMDMGTYGVCEKTGEEIPLERLKAYPAARTKVGA
jgi:RNA polymerase-binding transcription factor DksA